MTIDDVAAYLAVTRNTVHAFIRTGALIPVRVGHRWRFRPNEVEEYLERSRAASP